MQVKLILVKVTRSIAFYFTFFYFFILYYLFYLQFIFIFIRVINIFINSDNDIFSCAKYC